MRFGCTVLFSALLLSVAIPASATPHTRRGPASSHLFGKRNAHPVAKPSTGQRAIDSERATQIQSALIKQGYLTGEPSGKWDPETQAALEKLQGDNGWQTKLVPDSRAIIKLGLGPNAAQPETADAPTSSAPSFQPSSSEASQPAQQ